MIPLKLHNIADYILGAFLLVAPSLFGFVDVMYARNVFWIGGIVWIGYSLITRYYYSLADILSVETHMALDSIVGIYLIISPFIFGYRYALTSTQLGLHFALGFGLLAVVVLTDKHEVVLPKSHNTPVSPRF